MINMKFSKNDEGVSPIIATLVLIVVAIVGAAAVGLIMGSFSSNVANQANSGNAIGQSSTQLTIAGSSSMQPTVTTLGAWYTSNVSGVKVIVNGGGSGVGYMSVEKQMADLGMISEPINSAQKASYPNLQSFQIGASGVVFATQSASAANTVTKGDLATIYGAATAFPFTDSLGNTWTEAVTRSDVSGTKDTAFGYLGVTTPNTNLVGKNQNSGVEAEVSSAGGMKIAYLDGDYAFANQATYPVKVLKIQDVTAGVTYDAGANAANIIKQIKENPSGTSMVYPTGLIRPLNLISNGAPSSIADGFIQFCQQPNTANSGLFATNYQVADKDLNSAFVF